MTLFPYAILTCSFFVFLIFKLLNLFFSGFPGNRILHGKHLRWVFLCISYWPAVQLMSDISVLQSSWLKEHGLKHDSSKQRLRRAIWYIYLVGEESVLGHEVSIVNWLLILSGLFYSTKCSDHNYMNIKHTSLHEGVVQMQNGILFDSAINFNNAQVCREE